jgi:hypothetical protein
MPTYEYDPKVPTTRSCPSCGRVMRLVTERKAEGEHALPQPARRWYVCSNAACEYEMRAA